MYCLEERVKVALLHMRAEELKRHLDALLLAALEGGPRHGYAAWREFAATVSAVLEGGPCPDPA